MKNLNKSPERTGESAIVDCATVAPYFEGWLMANCVEGKWVGLDEERILYRPSLILLMQFSNRVSLLAYVSVLIPNEAELQTQIIIRRDYLAYTWKKNINGGSATVGQLGPVVFISSIFFVCQQISALL